MTETPEHPVVGPLFSSHVLERSVLVALQKWLPGYLTIACELNGIEEEIEGIKSWGLESDMAEDWPSEGMPALLVVAAGTTDDPEKGSGDAYRAKWRCDVIITVKAATGPKARRYAQVYAAAIRGALLQRRTLEQGEQVALWLGESIGSTVRDDEDPESPLCSVMNAFEIRHDDVVSWRRGPNGSPPIPADWPEVKDTEIETEIP